MLDASMSGQAAWQSLVEGFLGGKHFQVPVTSSTVLGGPGASARKFQ